MLGAASDESNAESGIRQNAMHVAAIAKKNCYELR